MRSWYTLSNLPSATPARPGIERSALPPGAALGLLLRFFLLVALFTAEVLAVTVWLDGDKLNPYSLLVRAIRDWGPFLLRYAVGFTAIFIGLAGFGFRAEILRYLPETAAAQLRWYGFAVHGLAMSAFLYSSQALYGVSPAEWIAPVWLALGLSAFVSGALAFVPLSAWRALLRITGATWLYAALVAGASILITNPSRALWEPASRLTLRLAYAVLSLLLPGTYVQYDSMRVRAPNFGVNIAPQCSGLEGIGLMLIFGTVWLWLFRKEFRFPQALLLLPFGAAAIYVLNVLRIVALVLIGNAGAVQIAIGGFHSQAGWIAFNAVALGFSAVALKIPIFARQPLQAEPQDRLRDSPTAAYLMPFLAVLAAGILSATVTAGFEWMYALRIPAAAFALWHFRRSYSNLDWHCTWRGPAAGLLVFGIWVGLDSLFGLDHSAGMPRPLAETSPLLRSLWLTGRVLGGVVLVPVAEELAFRGFLARRIGSPHFEGISQISWAGVLLSSLAFGALHGSRWPAGILAGIVYAMLMLRRPKIGDAVVAHATTNVGIAFFVLAYGNWWYW